MRSVPNLKCALHEDARLEWEYRCIIFAPVWYRSEGCISLQEFNNQYVDNEILFHSCIRSLFLTKTILDDLMNI